MAEIIYSKYSNERCRNFAVRTDICEEKDGGRFVEKTALYAEGNKHIENLGLWYEELTKAYAEVGFACNKCEAVLSQQGGESAGDGDLSRVRLEYLYGETLEEHLDSLLESEELMRLEGSSLIM